VWHVTICHWVKVERCDRARRSVNHPWVATSVACRRSSTLPSNDAIVVTFASRCAALMPGDHHEKEWQEGHRGGKRSSLWPRMLRGSGF
jgi:hypothetical protein